MESKGNRYFSLACIIGIALDALFIAYKLGLYLTVRSGNYRGLRNFLLFMCNKLNFDAVSLCIWFLLGIMSIVIFIGSLCRGYKRKYLPLLLFTEGLIYFFIFILTTTV